MIPFFSVLSAEPFTLSVSAAGARLWHSRLLPEGLAADHPDRAANLAHILLGHPQRAVCVIADDPAQEILLHHIPLLKGSDRRILLQRRLEEHCPAALFAACIANQPLTEQERLSFLHLPTDTVSSQWLHWLAALPNPPGGTIAVTSILASIINRLTSKDATVWTQGLVLTPEGVRQIVLHHRKPLLTRVIPLTAPSAEQLAASLKEAAQQAHHYLARYGWRDNQSEQLIAITPFALQDALRPNLPSDFLLLTAHDVGQWLRCPTPTPDPWSMYAIAARQAGAALQRFYLPDAKRFIQHQAISRWGWAAAAMLLLLCGISTGLEWQNHQHQRDRLSLAATERDGINAALAQTRAMMGDDMQARTRLRHARLLQQATNQTTPWPLLKALATALPPEIRLNELQWEAKGKDNTTHSALGLSMLPTSSDKDIMQQQAVELYATLADTLQKTLPEAKIQRTQTPFALAANQTFSDPAMLQGATANLIAARLEITLP